MSRNPSSTPKFTTEFAALRDHACSISVDRDTAVFIGGHHLDVKWPEDFLEEVYIPLKNPLNDKVFEYDFKNLKWTELPRVPGIQVKSLAHLKSPHHTHNLTS